MAEEFPSRTADEVEIPLENSRPADAHKVGKLTVWVQTLNTAHRDKADSEAQWTAGTESRRYRKGADGYAYIYEDFEAMEFASLIEFLVNAEEVSGRLMWKVEDKYPVPQRPERGVDVTEVQWTDEVAKHEEMLTKLGETRLEYYHKLSDEYRKKVESWTKPTKLKKATDCVLESRYNKVYADNLTYEILLRAVRKADDHTQRYFTSVAQIEDLDDDILEALSEKYRELDRVKPRDIPT